MQGLCAPQAFRFQGLHGIATPTVAGIAKLNVHEILQT